ncbi:MAG: PEPxxWA-CTERM sorting domain-containing protein [Pseudomonadota bacterium]
MKSWGIVAAAAVLTLSGLGAANAAVLTSLDRATFQAAVGGGVTLQNFDGYTAGDLLTDDGFVTYATTGGTPLVTNSYLTSTSPNGLGATAIGYFSASDTLTLTFASAITAFAIDINTFAGADGDYSVLLNTGDTALSIFETFPGTGTGQFIGFVSDTGFTSLTLSGLAGFSYTVDTLIYGEARDVTGGIPEPTTWALMLAGFGAVGASLRRRRLPALA